MLTVTELRWQTSLPLCSVMCKLIFINYFVEMFFRTKLFIKNPGRNLGILTFLQGFRFDAWIAFVVLLFVVPIFLFLFSQILNWFGMREAENWSYGWNLLVFTAAVAQQGQDNSPFFLSTRIVFLLMFISSVFLFENFSASYTSFLSVVSPTEPFTSVEELEQTNYVIGAMEGGATQMMFRARK